MYVRVHYVLSHTHQNFQMCFFFLFVLFCFCLILMDSNLVRRRFRIIVYFVLFCAEQFVLLANGIAPTHRTLFFFVILYSVFMYYIVCVYIVKNRLLSLIADFKIK